MIQAAAAARKARLVFACSLLLSIDCTFNECIGSRILLELPEILPGSGGYGVGIQRFLEMSFLKKLERSAKRLIIRSITRAVSAEEMPAKAVGGLKPRRVLVIRQHNQMGDMLLAVPALRAIKESLPDAETGVVCSTINRDVLVNNPYVDRLFLYNKRNPFSHLSLIRSLRSFDFDLVIVLHTVSFSLTSAILSVLSGAKIRAGSTSEPFGHGLSKALFHIQLPLPGKKELESMNEAEHNLYPLKKLGISTSNLAPAIFPRKAEWNWADKFLSSVKQRDEIVIVVHPGAGKKENIWLPKRFAEVVNAIGSIAPAIILAVQGPRDAGYVSEFCSSCRVRYEVIAKRKLLEVAAVMKRADLVLCNDTGMMHVSGAIGAPTLAVFGPTDVERWAPKCKNLYHVRAPGGDLSALDSSRVAEKAIEILALETGTERYS